MARAAAAADRRQRNGAPARAPKLPTRILPAPPVVIAPATKIVKLDLACGQHPREGFEGVDLYAPTARRLNLLRFPWPIDDSSVDELHCSHFIEHIDNRAIEPRDLVDQNPPALDRWVGVDMWFGFFDECWRILKPGGTMRVQCPALRSNRAFQDPTHRRYIAAETFAYLSADFRKANGLDHYPVRCDFSGQTSHIMPTEMGLLSPEAQAYRFHELWNQIIDWVADLKAIKPTSEKEPTP